MLFILDENFSPLIAQSLTNLEKGQGLGGDDPIVVVSGPLWAKEQKVKIEKGETSYTDDQLARLTGQQKGVFITLDKDFLKAKHKARLYHRFKTKVIFVKTYDEILGVKPAIIWFLQHWEEMRTAVKSHKAPCCFRLTKEGLEKMNI